jgi:hypothetical protein
LLLYALELTSNYATADKMENIMSTIGLSVDRLPPAGVTSLASLASLALTLDTKDTSLARCSHHALFFCTCFVSYTAVSNLCQLLSFVVCSYYLSLQDLDEELHDVSKKREEQQASLSGLLEKTRLAVARLDKMSKYGARPNALFIFMCQWSVVAPLDRSLTLSFGRGVERF